MLEYKSILKCEQDIAGKWRVLVDCGTENMGLKFQSEPTEDEVRAVALPMIERRNAELSAELVAKPVPEEDVLERMALENKYLLATKQLCELAGDIVTDGVWPKLEDIEFETKAIVATQNAPTLVPLILATLNYTYFQLKLRNWEWEQIEHRELPQ